MSKRILLAVAAMLLLLYVTLSMAPDRPPADAPHDAEGATTACQTGVASRMESSDFTLSPTVEYMEEGRYAVNGVVDGRMAGTDARRNYDCVVRYLPSDGYMVDSVSVWQSH